MKRTDLQKRERELRRSQKKEERHLSGEKSDKTIGDYIKELHGLMFFDATKVYNAKESVEILELLEEMQDNIDESQWETILRKAIKKTGVVQRDEALTDLKELMAD